MSSLTESLEKSPRLWEIARRLLAPERSYSEVHIKTKLETYLKVTPERAENGFSLMLKHGVLVPTYGDPATYYLGDTTPF